MKTILIAYELKQGVYSLSRPLDKISYSMFRISGQIKNLNKLNNLVKADECFDESLLNKLNLYFREI